MYDTGYKTITNIDISHVVIEQMKKKYRDREMTWETVDATAMKNYGDGQFSSIIDKGTLDAMMSEESDSLDITKYFGELSRVLKTMGRIVIISLLQEHILRALVAYFPSNSFHFRIVRCLEAEERTAETNEDGNAMPVFMVVATKFIKLPMEIFELSYDGETNEKLQDDAAVINTIGTLQRASMIRNVLRRKSNVDEEITFDVFRPNEKTPRYTLYIVDVKLRSVAGDYAAFICPQGRESEWHFSTKNGRKDLAESAKHSRLAIVTMHRNQIYHSLEDIQGEINDTIKSFAPFGLRNFGKIPFLSMGSVGKRETIYVGRSDFSGDFVVEDVTTDDDKVYRRLVFMSNQSAVQSESLMKKIKQKYQVDVKHLCCQHHSYILAGLTSVDQTKKLKNVVVGLGGGGLVSYIHNFVKNIRVTAIEIDPEIVKVAREFFNLPTSENLEIVVDDGLEYLNSADEQFQSILFDVDNKDLKLGMSCPPKEFLDAEILEKVKLLLADDGIFILNLVCRDQENRTNALNSITRVFQNIFSYKLDEDVNEIFYCFKSAMTKDKFLQSSRQFISMNKDIDIKEFTDKLRLN